MTILLRNDIAQFDDRAAIALRDARAARLDRAGWTGRNLILDEALVKGIALHCRANIYIGGLHVCLQHSSTQLYNSIISL